MLMVWATIGLGACELPPAKDADSEALEARKQREQQAQQQQRQRRPADGPEAVEASASAMAEDLRQRGCGDELEKIQAERRQSEAAERLRKDLSTCAASGLPAGTYQTAEGAPARIELEVTKEGCAAYEAMQAAMVKRTKTLEDRNGTYQREYNSSLHVCTVGGSLVLDPKLHASTTRRDGCNSTVESVIDEDAAWVGAKKATPTVTVVLADGKARVTLSRVSEDVATDRSGAPRLWAKARTATAAQDRVGVAFARPQPGQQGANIDAMYKQAADPPPPARHDYCRELDDAKR